MIFTHSIIFTLKPFPATNAVNFMTSFFKENFSKFEKTKYMTNFDAFLGDTHY